MLEPTLENNLYIIIFTLLRKENLRPAPFPLMRMLTTSHWSFYIAKGN